MLAEQLLDEDNRITFLSELDRINKTCPFFTGWIKRSLEETINDIGISEGEQLIKQSGALPDLKTIFDSITATPEKSDDSDDIKVKVGLACM
jgi:hypothetical protein